METITSQSVRQRTGFERVAGLRATAVAAQLLARDEADVLALYAQMAQGTRAPRRSRAVLLRAVTLASAYCGRWTPDDYVFDGLIADVGDADEPEWVYYQAGSDATFAMRDAVLFWRRGDDYVADALSAAPHGRALRFEARSGRARRVLAVVNGIGLAGEMRIRLVAPGVPGPALILQES